MNKIDLLNYCELYIINILINYLKLSQIIYTINLK